MCQDVLYNVTVNGESSTTFQPKIALCGAIDIIETSTRLSSTICFSFPIGDVLSGASVQHWIIKNIYDVRFGSVWIFLTKYMYLLFFKFVVLSGAWSFFIAKVLRLIEIEKGLVEYNSELPSLYMMNNGNSYQFLLPETDSSVYV